MISEYKITVNGEEFEVTVETISGGSTLPEAPRVSRKKTSADQNTAPESNARASAPPAAPVPKTEVLKKEVPAPSPAAPSPAGDGTVIEAPLPGNVWKVMVTEGQTIKRGDVLVILEAMKMENEIFSPVDGVVKSLQAIEGKSVGTGDTLCVIS